MTDPQASPASVAVSDGSEPARIAGLGVSVRRAHRWWERCGPWDVVGSSYQPPTGIKFGGGHILPGVMERAQQGATTVTERCQVCGRVRVSEFFGRVVLNA